MPKAPSGAPDRGWASQGRRLGSSIGWARKARRRRRCPPARPGSRNPEPGQRKSHRDDDLFDFHVPIAGTKRKLDLKTWVDYSDLPIGWVHLSYTLHELCRTQEAWDNLSAVAAKFPDNPTIAYNLACYACQLGNTARARDLLDRALTLDNSPATKLAALSDPDLTPLWTESQRAYPLRRSRRLLAHPVCPRWPASRPGWASRRRPRPPVLSTLNPQPSTNPMNCPHISAGPFPPSAFFILPSSFPSPPPARRPKPRIGPRHVTLSTRRTPLKPPLDCRGPCGFHRLRAAPECGKTCWCWWRWYPGRSSWRRYRPRPAPRSTTSGCQGLGSIAPGSDCW